MANSLVTQIVNDGPRNTVMKITGILDSGDVTDQVIITPAELSSMMPAQAGVFPPNFVALKQLDFVVEDGLEVRLFWEGDSDALIEVLTGRGCSKYKHFGALRNNAGNPSGNITLSTQGWTASSILSFTLILWVVKQDGAYFPDQFDGGVFNFSNQSSGGTFVLL